MNQFPFLVASDGAVLGASLHRPVDNLVDKTPGLVATGSWLTVKEQMADLYAERFVRLGYSVLTFDFAGFGKSTGEPRQTEMPTRKIQDIVAAARFMKSLACIGGDTVGYVAICATSMYVAPAIDAGAPIGAFASIAGWFHDAATVAPFYGGGAGVKQRLEHAVEAHAAYLANGELRMVPAYEGSERAGMFIHMDYYANRKRGRIPSWSNQMAEMTWLYWLTFDGLRPAKRLSIPSLFVRGDECALPDNVRAITAALGPQAELIWHPGFQVDFYDRPDLVELSVAAADKLFKRVLQATPAGPVPA